MFTFATANSGAYDHDDGDAIQQRSGSGGRGHGDKLVLMTLALLNWGLVVEIGARHTGHLSAQLQLPVGCGVLFGSISRRSIKLKFKLQSVMPAGDYAISVGDKARGGKAG